ncbi:MAG TPA: hypothetical protein VE944_19310 [Nostoc sp.]|uniref:hypothetical protein n=1 Tax=Nostoc sp. TaxID=1180 RepID=UPI002D32BD3D|nr:hypothetical protein [Nostoc sp.]HYX16471.1 hypothetical protein [Nostoc sp.]
MTRFTFAATQQYALDNGYELVRTSEGYSIYPCNGNLAERMGGYKARTLSIVIEVIKEGYGLHGQYCNVNPLVMSSENADAIAKIAYQTDVDWGDVDETPELSSMPTTEQFNTQESHYVINMFLIAFNVKLTATVIELYCAEISKECDDRSIGHPEIKPDLIGTAAMYLGFDANDLFSNAYCGYADDMPGWWFDCLNICTNIIQPIIANYALELLADELPLPDWFSDAIDMFTESEEDFNTRIILEEMYKSPEVLEPIYWDEIRNAFCDAPMKESIFAELGNMSRASAR